MKFEIIKNQSQKFEKLLNDTLATLNKIENIVGKAIYEI